jgi:hypothetical protein
MAVMKRFIEKLHIFFKEKRKVGEWFEVISQGYNTDTYYFGNIDGEDIEDDTDKLAYFFNHKEPTGIVIG